MFSLFLFIKPTTSVVLGTNLKTLAPWVQGLRLNFHYSGGSAGTRNCQRLKGYHVTNPMWRNGERREKEAIVVAEAHKPNHNLNSRTSTRQHPRCSPSPFYCLRLSFRVHTQLLKEVPVCKCNTKEKKEGFCKVWSWGDGKRVDWGSSLSLWLSNSPVSWWKCPAGWGH